MFAVRSKTNPHLLVVQDLPNLNFSTTCNVVDISTSTSCTCVLFDCGKIKCFGVNGDGQLGLGSISWSAMPQDFTNLGTGLAVRKVYVFPFHSCAVFTNDLVKCWGLNSDGQLGLGDKVPRGKLLSDMGNNLPFVDLGPVSIF
eukprot:765154-Hanusia_phi.AAC.2